MQLHQSLPWLPVLSFPPALTFPRSTPLLYHQKWLQTAGIRAGLEGRQRLLTDKQYAGKIPTCTFVVVKYKQLRRAFSKGPQTYFLKQNASPGWGRNTAQLGLQEGKLGQLDLQKGCGLWK